MFNIHPVTGASIEIFFADRALETFGRGHVRQRGQCQTVRVASD